MSRKIAVAGTSCLLGLGGLLTVSGVLAQPVAGVAATPTSQMGAPALEFVSPIGDYKAYEPQAVQSWKEANDTLAPGKSGTIIWQFTKAGYVNFACLMPSHYEAGMKGMVKVAKK